MPKPIPFTYVDFTQREMDRFWSKVIPAEAGSCWLWTGLLRSGYGQFTFRQTGMVSHRAAFMMLVGEIPSGLELDHLCRNTTCVNPDHLEPVTAAENMRRTRRDECAHGHPMTGDNLVIYSGGKNRPERRYCLTCTRERAKKSMSDHRRRNGVPERGRQTHCKHGHEFTEENTRWRKDRPGQRGCRACERERLSNAG